MYRFLDHPSEAFVQVNATTTEQVYAEAAVALFELMTETKSVLPSLEFTVELESPDRESLLVDWLNRLILIHETENVFLCRFAVHVAENESWKLFAKVYGERIMPGHERRMHVKSATYGQFEWKMTDDGHQVRFLMDI